MNRLLESPQTSCEVDGVVYTLNTGYAPALWTWRAYSAYELGEIDAITYATALCENMFLPPKPSPFMQPCLQLASDYLNAFSDRDKERKTRMPPYGYVAIEQDSDMIFSALLTKGVNVKRDNVTYEEFLAHLRDLPEGCEYANIMRLRVVWYDNRSKMTKQDRELMKKIGMKRILIRDAKAEKDQAENKDYFKELQAKLRAGRGL